MKNCFLREVAKTSLLFIFVLFIVALTIRFCWLGPGFLLVTSLLIFVPDYQLPTYYLFLGLMLFSNLAISFLSPFLADRLSMYVTFALDFFFAGLLLCWNLPQTRYRLPLSSRRQAAIFYLLIGLTTAFYLKGILLNGFVYATIYLRMLFYPFMLYLLGRYAASRLPSTTVKQWLITAGLLFGLLLIIEVLAPVFYYSLLNVNHYIAIKMKLVDFSVADLLARNTRRFFNSSWFKDFRVLRPLGAFMHPISTAYFFALCLMLCLSTGSVALSGFFITMVFLCGSKGAMVSALALIFFYFVNRGRPVKPREIILAGAGYVICSYFIGLKSNNSHFYSLTASVFSLPDNLWGRGFGYGGSVTTGVKRTLDFTTINGDSGLAVLINMTGIFTAFFYLGYMAVLHSFWKSTRLKKSAKTLCLVFFVFLLANSVFQEEGFSPYGMGLLMFLMGLENTSLPVAAPQQPKTEAVY